MKAGLLQGLDAGGKILDPKDHTIPSAGLLLLPVGQWPGSRRLWTAQQHLCVAKRDAGKRRKLLVCEREAEMRGVERDRTGDVLDLIANTVDGLNDIHLGFACKTRS